MPVVALDGYFVGRTSPDLLKIDVEGAEYQVLTGAQRILADRPVVFLEVHPTQLRRFGSSAAEVIGLMTAAGYDLFQFTDHRSRGGTLSRLGADAVLTANTMLECVPARRG